MSVGPSLDRPIHERQSGDTTAIGLELCRVAYGRLTPSEADPNFGGAAPTTVDGRRRYPAPSIAFSLAVVAGVRVLGTNKARERLFRVDFEYIARAVSATAGMHAIRQRGRRVAGPFTRARGRSQAWIIQATDLRVRAGGSACSSEPIVRAGHNVGVVGNTGPQSRDAAARASQPDGTALPAHASGRKQSLRPLLAQS